MCCNQYVNSFNVHEKTYKTGTKLAETLSLLFIIINGKLKIFSDNTIIIKMKTIIKMKLPIENIERRVKRKQLCCKMFNKCLKRKIFNEEKI